MGVLAHVVRNARDDELHLPLVAAIGKDAGPAHIEAALCEWYGALVGTFVTGVDKRTEGLRKIVRELALAGIIERDSRPRLGTGRVQDHALFGELANFL